MSQKTTKKTLSCNNNDSIDMSMMMMFQLYTFEPACIYMYNTHLLEVSRHICRPRENGIPTYYVA